MNVDPLDVGSSSPRSIMDQVGSVQVELNQKLESYKQGLVSGRFVQSSSEGSS